MAHGPMIQGEAFGVYRVEVVAYGKNVSDYGDINASKPEYGLTIILEGDDHRKLHIDYGKDREARDRDFDLLARAMANLAGGAESGPTT